jgi:hypothetical protein
MVEKVREERLVAGIQSKHLLAQAVTVSSTLLLSSTFPSALLISFLFLLFLVSFLFLRPPVPHLLTCFMHSVRPNFPNPVSHIVRLAGLTRAPAEPCADYVNLLHMAVEIPFYTALNRDRNDIAHMRVTLRKLSGERIYYRPVQLIGKCVRLFLHFALAHAMNSFP